MEFQITLVGLNHRTASVDVRERYALSKRCSPENWAIPCQGPLRECFILSTCNRVEILGIGDKDAENSMLRAWAKTCLSQVDELSPYVYIHHDLEAVRHVFEVASSLDSMVLGEPQILGQMKAAYRKAVESKNAGPIINRIMHKSFSVAKRVRHETAVAASAVSISYAAVELAKRIFGDMGSHKAMLIGAGEMAELAAMHLLQAGMSEILVANRTLARAEELARRFHGEPLPFDKFPDHLADIDIVIASTGSPEAIINANHARAALKARKNRPMFFIDIAVPRDIDPEVNSLDNVYLYDIDDLKEVVEENMHARREEACRAQSIIDEEVESFAGWLENLAAKPTILELVRRGDEAAEMELARTLRRLGQVSPEVRDALGTMAHALARKLNHEPIMFLKKDGMNCQQPHARISLVRRIFNLDDKKRHSHANASEPAAAQCPPLPQYRKICSRRLGIARGDRLLLAVSGGSDSLALAVIMKVISMRMDLQLVCMHVDHHLRKSSAAEAIFTRNFCENLGLACVIGHANVAELAEHCGCGIEEAGRIARHKLLEDYRKSIDAAFILTGHQAEDLAEDIILRMLRGAGWPALAGMRWRSGHVLRPLLRQQPETLKSFLDSEHFGWINDESNQSLAFRRNRVRHLFMPMLRCENPSICQSFGRIHEFGQMDADYWQALLDQALQSHPWRHDAVNGILILPEALLAPLHPAARLRLYHRALAKMREKAAEKGQTRADSLFRLEEIFTNRAGGKVIQCSGGITATLEHGCIVLRYSAQKRIS